MALRRFWQAQDAVEEQRAEGKAALVARERELQKHYAEDFGVSRGLGTVVDACARVLVCVCACEHVCVCA